MKTVELRRHSTKLGSGDTDLSHVGVWLAEKVVEHELRNKGFTLLFESPLKRTKETLAAFSKSAGDFPKIAPELFPPHMEVSETEEGMYLWSGVCHHAERENADMMQAALEGEPERTNALARKAATAFKRWLSALPENTNVLVVGHSPFIEIVAFGLFEKVIPQLQPCEGIRIVEQDQGYQLAELRLTKD
jgi:broad specificity phosphatase PhoE